MGKNLQNGLRHPVEMPPVKLSEPTREAEGETLKKTTWRGMEQMPGFGQCVEKIGANVQLQERLAQCVAH